MFWWLRMRFRIETLVDFGTLVPTQAELAPHDHPLENWTVEAFNDIISIAQVLCTVSG